MSLDELELARDATSMHQSSEWGMWAFQASFSCIKDCITIEYRGQQKLAHMYNLQTTTVEVNQILNVYIPSLDEDVNQLYIHKFKLISIQQELLYEDVSPLYIN
jgi:hypothetical protein